MDKVRCIGYLLPVLIFSGYIYYQYQYVSVTSPTEYIVRLDKDKPTVLPRRELNPDQIYILFWTKWFKRDPKGETMLLYTKNKKCFQNCIVVQDKRYFNVSDAVLFHSMDIRLDEFPKIHPKNQIWVYLNLESPLMIIKDDLRLRNVFNWTMTYRRDSDVYHPYFLIKPEPTLDFNRSSVSLQKILQKKKKLVAWIVSHCPSESKRELYVKELQRFIPVDIYGGCGTLKCPHGNHTGSECLTRIGREYKFYLSFENALCTDYITEKLQRALMHNIIPVVLGGSGYEYIAPPHSYINVRNFNSPKDLAEYLHFLDKNPVKYLEYFMWKEDYRVDNGEGFCTLCNKLREQKRTARKKYYPNLWKWWYYTDTQYNYSIDEIKDGNMKPRMGTKAEKPTGSKKEKETHRDILACQQPKFSF